MVFFTLSLACSNCHTTLDILDCPSLLAVKTYTVYHLVPHMWIIIFLSVYKLKPSFKSSPFPLVLNQGAQYAGQATLFEHLRQKILHTPLWEPRYHIK